MMKLTGLRNQKRTLDCTPSVSGRKLLFVMFVAGNTLGSLSKSRKYLGEDGAETLLRLLVVVEGWEVDARSTTMLMHRRLQGAVTPPATRIFNCSPPCFSPFRC